MTSTHTSGAARLVAAILLLGLFRLPASAQTAAPSYKLTWSVVYDFKYVRRSAASPTR